MSFVFDYTSLVISLKQIIFRNWYIIKHLQGCDQLLKTVFCKTSSLRNLLVKSDFYQFQPHILLTDREF